MKVLIIKTSALGDIIHALPVLDYLHQTMPGIWIDWVVEEQFCELLNGNPLIRRILVVRTRTWRKQPLAVETRDEIVALWQTLREEHYNLVFDIQGNLKSGIIALATGIKESYGFATDHLQEKVNRLLITHQVRQRPEDDHATARYARIVSAPFGRDYRGVTLIPQIYTGPEHDAVAESVVTTTGFAPVLLFHGGTTWQTKFWSELAWIKLGYLVCTNIPAAGILLTWGNESERESAARVADSIGSRARLLDRYPLKGVAAILKKVDVVVGGDTGLIHLAAAVGTPTVSYYRASDGSASGPRGERHVIIQSPLACTRCQRTSCSKNEECQASITPEMVYAGVEKVLNQSGWCG